MIFVRSLRNVTNYMCRDNCLTPFMKGNVRSFGLCSYNLQDHKSRYHNPWSAEVEEMKKKRDEEQRKVEEIKKLAESEPKHQEDSPRPRPNRNPKYEIEENFAPYRYIYPEFLPDPKLEWRNRIREKLERMDMLKRRANIEIPEFYVGSIMKVTVADKNTVGKIHEFVGLCIERGGCGLRANFTLRNVIDGQGVEIRYQMYNPIIQSIQVLRLEKRLDESLRYLRDCPLEYSTIPFDMQPELRNPDAPVPINTTLVTIKPKPWTVKWHLYDIRGIENLYDQIDQKWELRKWAAHRTSSGVETNDFDLMKIYRETIPAEEQTEIFSEIGPQLAKLTQTLKKQKRKRVFAKPQKIA